MFTLIRKFMETQNYSPEHQEQIEEILDFLMARAKGEVPTGAKFIREYIVNHPLYKNDSKISKCLQCCLINQITNLNKDQSNICGCQATNSDIGSHDSDCCDNAYNFLKNKCASKKSKNNTLFDISSEEDNSENKLILDSLDQAERENLCNDFKKKIKDANMTKE